MTEKRPLATACSHLALAIGILVLAFPLYYTFVASSLSSADILRPPIQMLPGDQLLANYSEAIDGGVERAVGVSLERLLWNSLVVAMLIALGKIIVSFLSAFAVVFFRFPLRLFFFWLIFITLMLPVEVRIVPTYQVMVDFGLLDSYAGLTLPLMASATATLLFRQFFLTIPNELVEAARLDNAGPLRFMRDIVLPLSTTNIAALFVILFVYGWTQYLWPLLVTNDAQMNTIIVGLARMVDYTNAATRWNYVMVTAVLAIVPPVMVVVLMQRWFVKGLVEGEK